MPELDELIQADADNIGNSRTALTSFDPELSAALDTAAGMFTTFSRCIGGALDESVDWETLNRCAEELGIDGNELALRIDSETQDPAINRARIAWFSLYARRARIIVFLLLQRQFMWAATDLLRMRLTPAYGYGRQQAESLAWLFLMRDDPAVANRWLSPAAYTEGRHFHNEFQGRIRGEIERLELSGAYEEGSGASLHVRLASAIGGLVLDRQPTELLLAYQEVRPEDPFRYFLEVLYFLRTQERVFRALGDAFPEVSDPIWPERVRIFSRTFASLWNRLEQAFPEQSEQYRRIGGEI